MIIDDTHQFVFVHIPKCAGSSVHAQLSLLDKRDAAFHRGGQHPTLGQIHFAHLPLVFLRDHFPAEFQKVTAYRSFALTRDPRARFVSAVIQHLREFRGVERLALDSATVVREAHAIIDWLGSRGPFCDEEYIHFSRQVDYVELDGERVVGEIFPIENMAAFAARLRELWNIDFDHSRRSNTSLVTDHPFLGAARLAKPIYAKLTRWKDRERLLLWMRRSRLADHKPLYEVVLRDAKIARFIEGFYADDFHLRHSALAKTAGVSSSPVGLSMR